ncbi:lamin tail domain-containing protein [Candidatus Kaiserbacteria bacterium]|nr:lamin tail domain-containing protein [Candidatus Kaiserbacteria bacterium]
MRKGLRSRTTLWSASFATSSSLFVVMVALPLSVNASVVISEFLYDAQGSDTGKEWVELFNTGPNAVDISKWKVSDGSNHVLNAPPKNGSTGSMTLAPGTYAILAGDAAAFLGAHAGLGVSIIDTTLSLGNAAGSISIRDASSTVIDSVSYTKSLGATGDGNSLQKTSAGVWIGAIPTPGQANAEVAAAKVAPVVPSKAASKKSSTQATSKTRPAVVEPDVATVDDVRNEPDVAAESIVPISSDETAAANAAMNWGSPWLLGAIGIAMAAAGAGVIARKSKKTEWDIEEMPSDV